MQPCLKCIACGKSLTDNEISTLMEFYKKDIMTRAKVVFGNDEAVASWLTLPASGLGNRYPKNMFGNVDDIVLLRDFITRMEYGVYI
jgi:putative toxin-antitoxin system antitoxin component (TIGR02293 family)